MLRIAICEDRIEDAFLLRKTLETVQQQLDFEASVELFQRGEDLLIAIQTGQLYHLLLMDIFMDQLDGIQTAKRAKEILPSLQVAFLSSSREFAPEAFELNAIHYLIKPVETDRLRELFERFFERIKIPVKTVEIKTESKTYTFPLHHIQKIQSRNKGIEVYLKGMNQPQRIAIPFIHAEEQLDPQQFLRISRGLLVQMEYISYIDKDVCHFQDGTQALISRRERTEIRKRYNDYLFSKFK